MLVNLDEVVAGALVNAIAVVGRQVSGAGGQASSCRCAAGEPRWL